MHSTFVIDAVANPATIKALHVHTNQTSQKKLVVVVTTKVVCELLLHTLPVNVVSHHHFRVCRYHLFHAMQGTADTALMILHIQGGTPQNNLVIASAEQIAAAR
jgi:hypothetical protein